MKSPNEELPINKQLNKINPKVSYGKPELQFHAAATLIAPALDPHSLKPEERNDREHELGQFCVRVDPKMVGNLRREAVRTAFEALYQRTLKRLREHGVLKQGE